MYRIDFENGYILDIDSRNYTLKKNVIIKTKDDGTEYEKYDLIGYMRSFNSAVKEMFNDHAKSKLKNYNDIKSCIDIFNNAWIEMDKTLDIFRENGGIEKYISFKSDKGGEEDS